MKFVLILSFILAIVESKCSIDDHRCCNDLEMFNQCKTAQQQIDEFVNEVDLLYEICLFPAYVPELYCDQDILCCVPSTSNDTKYTKCQNMDSYNKCKSASAKLEKFIVKTNTCVNISSIRKPSVYCQMDKDVYNYYESSGNILEAIAIWILVAIIMVIF